MPQELMKAPWTDDQIDALDRYVRVRVRDFLAWAEAFKQRTGNLPHFEDCEIYVDGSEEYDGTLPHLTAEECAQILTREVTVAEGLVGWIRDNGLGAWSELRDEQPALYTPAAMFAEVVASWLHDIIGCPSPPARRTTDMNTTDTAAVAKIRERQAELMKRRDERYDWVAHFERDQHPPYTLAGWCMDLAHLDHSIQELGLLMRDMREAGL